MRRAVGNQRVEIAEADSDPGRQDHRVEEKRTKGMYVTAPHEVLEAGA